MSTSPATLHELAEQSCGLSLRDAERALLDKVSAGGEIAFDAEVEVRPALLRWLMTAEPPRRLFQGSGLRIDHVRVTGDIDLSATTLPAVVCFRRVTIAGQLLLRFARTRTILFQACRIDHLDLEFATIDGTLGVSEFDGKGCRVKSLTLRDAKVAGNIDIRYSRFPAADAPDENAPSIDITRTSIEGSVFIAPGNVVERGIVGVDARVGGNLDLVDLVAHAPAGAASVDLRGARIDGNVYMHAPEERAPYDERLGHNGRTEVSGGVLLAEVRVGGNVDLTKLSVHRRDAIGGDDVVHWWGVDLLASVVDGSILLNRASVWDGGVRLSHVRVAGNVECDELILMRTGAGGEPAPRPNDRADGPRAPAGPSLEIILARVSKVLIWRVVGPRSERVVLNGSSVDTFEYNSVYWPDRSELESFTFAQIRASSYPFRRPRLSEWAGAALKWSANDPPSGVLKRWVHDRLFAPDRSHLDWVRTSTRKGWEFDRRLYEHVAAALARQGQPDEGRRVLVAGTNDGNRARGWLWVLLGLPYRVFAGNGYRPELALWWAVGLILAGAFVFGHAYDTGALVPLDPAAVAQPFHRLVYSADVLLPIVDLHQARGFEAAGPGSGFVRLYLWLQISLGWIIATALGAAAAGFVRRSGSS